MSVDIETSMQAHLTTACGCERWIDVPYPPPDVVRILPAGRRFQLKELENDKAYYEEHGDDEPS